MIEFELLRPLWMLGLIPAFVLWWSLNHREDSLGPFKSLMDPHLLEYLKVGQDKRKLFRPVNLLLVMWILSVAILSGPSWEAERSPFADDEAGLMVLLKVSETMNARDVAPSRLERAKLKLRDILERREGSPSGLIVYSGSAHLVMPLTRDDQVISTMIEDLTPNLMPVDGDSLADALKLADKVFQRAKIAGSIVVIADSVSESQRAVFSGYAPAYPVQFLAVKDLEIAVDTGMKSLASQLNARLIPLSADKADVQSIASRAETHLTYTSGNDLDSRRRDNGYILLPLLAACALLWSRKGWVIG